MGKATEWKTPAEKSKNCKPTGDGWRNYIYEVVPVQKGNDFLGCYWDLDWYGLAVENRLTTSGPVTEDSCAQEATNKGLKFFALKKGSTECYGTNDYHRAVQFHRVGGQFAS